MLSVKGAPRKKPCNKAKGSAVHSAQPTAARTPPPQEVAKRKRSVESVLSSDATFCKDGITVLLHDTAIWNEFNRIGNEMIVTKPGRRMFPSLNVTLKGLVDAVPYTVGIRTRPFDKNRYKYLSKRWIAVGPSEVDQKEDRQLYQHPSGTNNGSFWMKRPINFPQCKITHHSHGRNSNILVHTMHKYQLEVEIQNTRDKTITAISLPLTQFIAVTAYLNSALTQLKIDKNPFAKGFRNENTVKPERHLNSDPLPLIPAPPQAAVNCSQPQPLPCVRPQAGAIDESTPGHFVAPRPRTVPLLENPRLKPVRTGYLAPPLPPPVKRRRIITNGFGAPSPLATSQQCAATFDAPALEQWAPRNRPSVQPVEKFDFATRAPSPLMIATPEHPLPDDCVVQPPPKRKCVRFEPDQSDSEHDDSEHDPTYFDGLAIELFGPKMQLFSSQSIDTCSYSPPLTPMAPLDQTLEEVFPLSLQWQCEQQIPEEQYPLPDDFPLFSPPTSLALTPPHHLSECDSGIGDYDFFHCMSNCLN